MKQANKAGARYVLIIGDDEMLSGKGVLRNMQNKEEQQEIPLSASAVVECIK
jgi:histidyl-tRNA synthetase